MGEKRDILISLFVALWATILVFSMLYMPALAAELSKEDEAKKGDLSLKGWVVKAHVKGYYYDGAQTFHHTYHKSVARVFWFWTVRDAVWEFIGKDGGKYGNIMYYEDGHFKGEAWDNYYKSVDYAKTYTWAHFERWGTHKYVWVEVEISL